MVKSAGYRGRAALLVVLVVMAAACGPSAEEREAAAVLRAVDVLRDAPAEPAARRRELLEELTRVPAVEPRAARARDDCARAYRLLLDGTALEAKVRAALADPAAITPGVLGELVEAEAKVKESAAAMPACDTAVADLRRWIRGPQ
ncbi:MAG TPA: hypothetical protein VLS89_01410 [Candidatus Nanopelagicales bacterium]|nr:hypothetical protein [Candidatus Nanopelagicales bacterium]